MDTRTALNLTDVEREELSSRVRAPRTPRPLADRCRVMLPSATESTLGRLHGLTDVWGHACLAPRLL